MRNKIFFLLAVIFVLSVLGVSRWYDYQEKDLVNVLQANKIEKIMYHTNASSANGSTIFDQMITEPASILELVEFLSQYKVKKISTRNFTSANSDEQFYFVIEYKDGTTSAPSLLERNTALAEQNQYAILNGPIDYEWLKEFLNTIE